MYLLFRAAIEQWILEDPNNPSWFRCTYLQVIFLFSFLPESPNLLCFDYCFNSSGEDIKCSSVSIFTSFSLYISFLFSFFTPHPYLPIILSSLFQHSFFLIFPPSSCLVSFLSFFYTSLIQSFPPTTAHILLFSFRIWSFSFSSHLFRYSFTRNSNISYLMDLVDEF